MGSTKRVSAPKHQRAALAQAIGNRVQELEMGKLLQLAKDLNVVLPSGLKAVRSSSARPLPARAKAPSTSVLKGSGIGPVASVADSMRMLDALTVDDLSTDWADSELVGAGELVERLNIARATLDNWRNARKIFAFRKGLRNFVYPLRQFERLAPIEGLDKIAALFVSPEEGWEWLVAPNPLTEGRSPIEVLRDGDVNAVVCAAEGALDYA